MKKEFIGFKIQEDLKRVLEQKAMEKGLSLSDFIRQTVEGTLDQEFATKEDIDYLDKKISILEKEIKNNILRSFKEFGAVAGRTISEKVGEAVANNLSGKKSTPTQPTMNKNGSWKEIPVPTYEEALQNENAFLYGDVIYTEDQHSKELKPAAVERFDTISITYRFLENGKPTGKSRDLNIKLLPEAYQRIKKLQRKV